MKGFVSIAKPYWFSEERWVARGLLAVVVALTLLGVYVAVLFNRWDGEIFNSIQQFDQKASIHALLKWPLLVILLITVTTYQAYLMQMLSIRWRRWMTRDFLQKYLSNDTFYFWQLSQNETDNPDQRITEDVRDFIDKTITLFVGVITELTTLISFVAILWMGSGPFSFTLLGRHFRIPGYMFWACLLYTFLGTGLIHLLGRRLIRLDYDQQKYEANFRFSLVRLREHAESIALNSGAENERRVLDLNFNSVFSNFWEIMVKKKQLSFFTLPYNRASGFFLMALTLPKFFAKEMTLGTLTILQGAFFKVKNSLSFFVNTYAEIALWRSILLRLSGFIESVERAKNLQKSAASKLERIGNGSDFQISNISLALPNQRVLIDSLTTQISPGKYILISGPSGCGKSTLFRAISGIWPFMRGSIQIPAGQKILIVPQKSYMPISTLREALFYPMVQDGVTDLQLKDFLFICALDHLRDRLNERANWAEILSPGEQQRVAFIRAFLHKPDWLLLDEATSALDEKSQETLYRNLRKILPGTTVISIAHRESLAEFHDIKLDLGTYALKTYRANPLVKGE